MVTVDWYSAERIHELEWPDDAYGRYAKRYVLPMLLEGVPSYIANVQTELLILTVDGIPLPITINEADYTNSYVCSPYTHYVSYAEEELAMLQRPRLEKALSLLLRGIGWCLRRIHFNRVVQINNWLVSTNLYPQLTFRAGGGGSQGSACSLSEVCTDLALAKRGDHSSRTNNIAAAWLSAHSQSANLSI